jgi:hypothetical protein
MSNKEQKNTVTYRFGCLHQIFGILTAMIGYNIHHSIFWSIIDFIFSPLVWCKWLICQEVNMSIIKKTFEFFLK